MKKSIFFSMIIVLAIFSSCSRSAKDHELESLPSLEKDGPSSAEGTQSVGGAQTLTDNNGIVWLVEPTLDYDDVYYCTRCGYTANTFIYILDESTGQIAEEHEGHGGPYSQNWLYDSENGMFGLYRFGWDEEITIHSVSDFPIHFSSYSDTLNYVRQVNFNDIIMVEDDWENFYKLGDKYENSKYAISYGSTLLTEFIYDRSDNMSVSLEYKYAIPVSINGKWGFIDKRGNLIIPLIFDHVATSDGDTAFVKINNKYGIIDVQASAR